MGSDGTRLRRAIQSDRNARPRELVLDWKQSTTPARQIEFLGVTSRRVASAVSGGLRTEWLGTPVKTRVPVFEYEAATTVTRPRAYWIPPAWPEVIERLRLHGIRTEAQDAATLVDVTLYRIVSAAMDTVPFEGHQRFKPRVERVSASQRSFPAGSVRVPTDQPLGDLAMLLLEPESPDSFFQWGFFLEVLQRTEYVESYIMEPMAERMIEESPELRAAFERALADPAFASSPAQRLQWFYRQTPFFDPESRLYPVARE
jgi:hypothetical protein